MLRRNSRSLRRSAVDDREAMALAKRVGEMGRASADIFGRMAGGKGGVRGKEVGFDELMNR